MVKEVWEQTPEEIAKELANWQKIDEMSERAKKARATSQGGTIVVENHTGRPRRGASLFASSAPAFWTWIA